MNKFNNKTDLAVENIVHDGNMIACIIKAGKMPDKTEFITSQDARQQVGFIVYPKGGEIFRHVHLPIERHLTGTSEVLLVRKGAMEVDFYTDDRVFICTRKLHENDLVLLLSGGHGFRCLEDTILLEVKQGPYTGLAEKERF